MTKSLAAPRHLAAAVGLALLVASLLGCGADAPSTIAARPLATPSRVAATQSAATQPAPTQAVSTHVASAPRALATQAASYPAAESASPAEVMAYPAAVAVTPSVAAPTAQAAQPTAQPKAAQSALTITIAHTNDVAGEVDPCG